MIDPSLFTVERLLSTMFDDLSGNVDSWRKDAEIVPSYMPPYPSGATDPRCVVKYGTSFLRHSAGPRQGYFWDAYGDDMQTPELALLALLNAPIPPWLVDGRKRSVPKRKCPLCGRMTRESTAGCDHCELEDK